MLPCVSCHSQSVQYVLHHALFSICHQIYSLYSGTPRIVLVMLLVGHQAHYYRKNVEHELNVPTDISEEKERQFSEIRVLYNSKV